MVLSPLCFSTFDGALVSFPEIFLFALGPSVQAVVRQVVDRGVERHRHHLLDEPSGRPSGYHRLHQVLLEVLEGVLVEVEVDLDHETEVQEQVVSVSFLADKLSSEIRLSLSNRIPSYIPSR